MGLEQIKKTAEAEEMKKQDKSSRENFYACRVLSQGIKDGEVIDIVVGYFNIFKRSVIVKKISKAIEIKYPELTESEFEEKVIKALEKNLSKFTLEALNDNAEVEVDIDIEV